MSIITLYHGTPNEFVTPQYGYGEDIHNAPQLQPEPEPETKSNPISNPGGFWS